MINAETMQISLDGIFENIVKARLAKLREGQMTIVMGEQQLTYGNDPAFAARVEFNNKLALKRLVLEGSAGAGASYADGDWECDRLTDLIRIFARNQEVLDQFDHKWTRILKPFQNIGHFLRRNTVAGSRRNISEHYDLGNDYFKLLLDETMSYSCAYFPDSSTPLAEASRAKIKLALDKLDLQPHHHLLEIGTGWGELAITAARDYGCKVTTVTISQQQYEYAQARISAANLKDRINLQICDYRTIEGQYDRIVSIEMLEAVGDQFYGTFFSKLSEVLREDGRALLQSITIADSDYEAARDGVDFIKKYIFPGGNLPSVEVVAKYAALASKPLQLVGLQDLTPHYAKTLQLWRANLHKNSSEIRKLGYPERLIRLWHFYFSYCEAGFLERTTGVYQFLLYAKRAVSSID